MKNQNEEIVLHPISSPKDYETLLFVFAFGKLEQSTTFFEWWIVNGKRYRIDEWDIEQLEKAGLNGGC